MNKLIQAALDVRKNAYAPYSNFLVGAALLTADDKIFVGCNVENASYGLAICAERHAIGAAVAAGHQKFKAIAVTASPLASPCGACRQYIFEFGDDIQIIGVDANDPTIIKNWISGQILPDGFRL
jgi:cytidine deaminase